MYNAGHTAENKDVQVAVANMIFHGKIYIKYIKICFNTVYMDTHP